MELLAELSYEELREYLARDDRIILPLGAVEEHGRHLGLGTDSYEAEAIAHLTSERTGVVVAPTLPYGQSLSQMGFPGTVSLLPTTLIQVLKDILTALYRHGFRRILVVNGHGGNTSPLTMAVVELALQLPGLRCKNFQWWTDPESYSVVTDALGPQTGSHAADGETSFMLKVRPSAVKTERLTGRDAPIPVTREIYTEHLFSRNFPDGIMGNDPIRATSALGEELLRRSVEICARELESWE